MIMATGCKNCHVNATFFSEKLALTIVASSHF